MKSNELRIGNLVIGKDLDGLNNSIGEDKIQIIDPIKLLNLQRYSPIPLTEEFVSKHSLISFTAEYDYAHISFYKDNENKWFGILTDIDEQKIGKPCYFIHEIQNLYYSIEHKELEIK